MNKKRLIIILTVVAMLFTVVACSAGDDAYRDVSSGSVSADAPMNNSGEARNMAEKKQIISETTGYEDEYVEEEVYSEDLAVAEAPTAGAGEVGGGAEQTPADDARERKLVTNTYLDLQTKEFDKAIETIEKAVEDSKGYIQNSSVYNGNISSYDSTNQGRTSNYTVKIPSKSAESFVALMSDNFHVVSNSKSTDDITAGYYDTQTKLETLVEHEGRLNALLDKGGDLEYIIEIERELASVRYEINSINSQIKNMDIMVDFNTVTINISEVIEYKETDQIADSFGTRISRALTNSWVNFVNGIENFAVGAVYRLPAIIIFVIVLVVVIIIVKASRKKKKANKVKEEKQDIVK